MRFAGLALAALGLVFLVVRVPLMYRTFGGQDEDYYAVPGSTILDDGIPRIPYVPSRDPSGVFHKADEALFALPPAYFYLQAAVFSVFGPGYGQARLTSAFAGLAALWCVYQLGKRFYGSERVALAAAGLYSLSRVFFFPATFARPDMLCATFGLAAALLFERWRATRTRRELAAAGALAGAALLTHPFALVVCIQLFLFVLLVEKSWRGRLASASLLVGCAALVFALWTPLIAAHPEAFESQFLNNVWRRSGPGLPQRVLFPWRPMIAQSRLLLEHAGPFQTSLMTAGLLLATIVDVRSEQRGRRIALGWAWSSVALLVVCQGEHPAKGYWCYPGAFLFLCVARSLALVGEWISKRVPRTPTLAAAPAVIALMLMLPGSGLRAWVAHLRHWGVAEYDHRRFVERLLRDLPVDARYLVDVSYVLDFHLAGRDTTLALDIHPYFEAAGLPYDYLILGPTGLAQRLPDRLGGRLAGAYGLPDDPFACYAEVYRPRASTPVLPSRPKR